MHIYTEPQTSVIGIILRIDFLEAIVDIPERPSKPMFIDESAEWEDESTMNSPAKNRLLNYLSEYENTPDAKQSLPQPPTHQSQTAAVQPVLPSHLVNTIQEHVSVTGTATNQTEHATHRANQLNPSSQVDSQTKGAIQMTEADNNSSDDDDDPPKSELLQKLFPTVSTPYVSSECTTY